MKSMCQDVRRNSPSVADRSPASRCMATTSRMAASSAAASAASSMSLGVIVPGREQRGRT